MNYYAYNLGCIEQTSDNIVNEKAHKNIIKNQFYIFVTEFYSGIESQLQCLH